MIFTQKEKDLLQYVQSLFENPVYLVGGAVRDMLLNREPKDYDFCSSLSPDEIKESLKGRHRAYLTGERHGTIGFRVGDDMIEITTFRTESYNTGNRQPNVEFVKSIDQDLGRRDFTINAMAIRCDNFKLIDPFGGKNDLSNGILKTVGNSKIRFKEDPLRILRGIRLASKYSLTIESKTLDRIKKMTPTLLGISKERWMEEFDKILILKADALRMGVHRLFEYDVFKYLIPELSLQFQYNQNSKYHDFKLHEHTIKVVVATPDDIVLRWAALLHDIAKPFVRTENKKGYSNYINHEVLGAEIAEKTARYLKWSNERRIKVVNLIRNHLNDDCALRKYDNLGKKI